MEYSTKVTKNLVPRFLEDLTELIIDKRDGDYPEVAGFDRVFEMPRLGDAVSDFKKGQKDLTITGHGLGQQIKNHFSK